MANIILRPFLMSMFLLSVEALHAQEPNVGAQLTWNLKCTATSMTPEERSTDPDTGKLKIAPPASRLTETNYVLARDNVAEGIRAFAVSFLPDNEADSTRLKMGGDVTIDTWTKTTGGSDFQLSNGRRDMLREFKLSPTTATQQGPFLPLGPLMGVISEDQSLFGGAIVRRGDALITRFETELDFESNERARVFKKILASKERVEVRVVRSVKFPPSSLGQGYTSRCFGIGPFATISRSSFRESDVEVRIGNQKDFIPLSDFLDIKAPTWKRRLASVLNAITVAQSAQADGFSLGRTNTFSAAYASSQTIKKLYEPLATQFTPEPTPETREGN